MATSDQRPSSSSSSATPSTNSDAGGPSFYSFNREPSGSSSSSTSTSRLRQEDEDRDRYRDRTQEQLYPPHFTQPEIEQQEIDVHVSGSLLLFDQASPISDDTWSCVIVVLTFWLFLSMTLILGVYGPASFSLGPNASLLIEPNPIFVQSIKVVEVDDKNLGPMLYGFYESPPLDVVENWSTVYTVSVPADSHEEWIFYLNEGSEIHISYNVNSTSSVFLVIAQGNEGLAEWLQDPTYPNTTLSWNIIQGSGTALQNIWRSSFYYVALGNMNSEQAEVDLNLTIRAFLYNTTTAFYNCNFADSMCSSEVLFPSGTPIVLTSPHPKQGSFDNQWNVKLSYGPRWATYILGLAGMTVLMLVAFKFLNNFRFIREEGGAGQFSETAPERAPFLFHKDDDLSSWGSSYDALSNDEEDCEDLLLAGGSLEGKPSRDGEDGNNNNTRRLCAICFDAPRDCFFLPCGHCVACFACGTRIVEAAGTCPICRRNMKKVRKIFTV